MYVYLQEEKAVLKAKAKKDEELQTRASISIPLVEEKEDDVRRAKSTVFATGSSVSERKRKRREIKSQSVFGDVCSPGAKAARQSLLKAQVRMDRSVFGSSSQEGGVSVKERRSSLGIRTSSSGGGSGSSSSSATSSSS